MPTDDLVAEVTRFETLDREFIDHLQGDDISQAAEMLRQAFSARRRIQWMLARRAAVVASNALAESVRKLQAEEFAIQKFMKNLDGTTWGEWDEHSFDDEGGYPDDHINDLLMVEQLGERSLVTDRLLECHIVIVGQSLPGWIVRHLYTIRRCYALNLLEPALVFCRSLLETAGYEWLAQRQLLTTGPNVRDQAAWRIRDCLSRVAAEAQIPALQMQTVWRLVERCNRILHLKEQPEIVTDAEVLQAMRLTASFVGRLFAEPSGEPEVV